LHLQAQTIAHFGRRRQAAATSYQPDRRQHQDRQHRQAVIDVGNDVGVLPAQSKTRGWLIGFFSICGQYMGQRLTAHRGPVRFDSAFRWLALQPN
jgi:hypothetical protein